MEQAIYYPFKIVDKVYCCWDMDIRKSNMNFIDSFDPEYFYFTAESFREALKGGDKYRAALAIRNIYHHSLETFFSLVCATIQAPFCIYAWINLAQIGNIRTILRYIKSSKKFYTQFDTDIISWPFLASKIFLVETVNKGNSKITEYSELFARLWESLSNRFLDDFSIKEYNSIKHGFRLTSGGHSLIIGPSGSLNDPSRQSELMAVSNSDFGSSFYVVNKIEEKYSNDPNIQIKNYAINWNPESLLHDIKLIFISIHNILSFLKLAHGAEFSKTPFLIPEDSDYFEEHWKSVTQTSTMKYSFELDFKNIKLFTSEELEEMLSNK